jgi:hypothetical protein
MKKIFLFFLLLYSFESYTQCQHFSIENKKTHKSVSFNYNHSLVFQLHKYANFKYSKLDQKLNVFRAKLLHNTNDSLYFNNELVIAYKDIDWFYVNDYNSFFRKSLGLGIMGLAMPAAYLGFEYPNTNYFLALPLMSLAWFVMDGLESKVYKHAEWNLFIPPCRNHFRQTLDQNPRLIYKKK